MPTEAAPNVVQWLTLAAATVGTALSTWTAIWLKQREEKEHFDIYVDWEWLGACREPELPFVYIHNRSKHTINIVDLRWISGAIYRKQSKFTAKFGEGPEDFNFPYEVETGSFRKIFLDEIGAQDAFNRSRRWADFFGLVGRSSVWLKVTTMRGNSRAIGAERVLPWRKRPKWITGEDMESTDA